MRAWTERVDGWDGDHNQKCVRERKRGREGNGRRVLVAVTFFLATVVVTVLAKLNALLFSAGGRRLLSSASTAFCLSSCFRRCCSCIAPRFHAGLAPLPLVDEALDEAAEPAEAEDCPLLRCDTQIVESVVSVVEGLEP